MKKQGVPDRDVVAGKGRGRLPARISLEARDGFVFDADAPLHRYSDAQLLSDLKAFYRKVGRPFSCKEFTQRSGRRCRSEPITRRFGSWRAALARAGIAGGQGRYSPREAMERLENAWRCAGRRPGRDTLERYGPISAMAIVRRWGSVRNACNLLARYKQGQISIEQLLASAKPLRGRAPIVREYPATPPKPGVRRSMKPGQRWQVLARDGHRCRGCGRSADEKGVRLEVDHIVPICRGGSDDLANLRALCRQCNRGKAGKGAGKQLARDRNPPTERGPRSTPVSGTLRR